ncbi:aldose 1-epimerase [Psychromonas marina]|uniref:Aldose 1-epimerase n=1 Tax=Psychromonas marina TaxID=88364 RepID=A0ABQ6E0Y9_9GAMM|nr:galactose-1-epimerase [Psychromonas marina]GLS91102.1 aldose 1-epimerase [Psychromonas marina]
MTIEQDMTLQPFSDGLPANIFTLTNQHGSSIAIMDIGATWLSCKIQMQDGLREVLLGIDSMQKHLAQQAYFGATVGRYANRIKGGKFTNAGQCFHTARNEGENTLHGGIEGFDKRRWQVIHQDNNKITFSLFSKDGDQGFPGNLSVNVSYHFSEQNEVTIDYSAVVDKCCPVNLTNHAYFNLMGDQSGLDCLSHSLQIHADRYLPTNHNGIPLGELQFVTNSSFDFLQKKAIQQDFLTDVQQKNQLGYDHAFILKEGYQDAKKVAVTLTAPDASLQLQVKTNKPAMQLYTGNFLLGTPGRATRVYENNAGIALETQYLPDAPNNPQWPQPTSFLQADKKYQSTTCYCFRVL